MYLCVYVCTLCTCALPKTNSICVWPIALVRTCTECVYVRYVCMYICLRRTSSEWSPSGDCSGAAAATSSAKTLLPGCVRACMWECICMYMYVLCAHLLYACAYCMYAYICLRRVYNATVALMTYARATSATGLAVARGVEGAAAPCRRFDATGASESDMASSPCGAEKKRALSKNSTKRVLSIAIGGYCVHMYVDKYAQGAMYVYNTRLRIWIHVRTRLAIWDNFQSPSMYITIPCGAHHTLAGRSPAPSCASGGARLSSYGAGRTGNPGSQLHGCQRSCMSEHADRTHGNCALSMYR